MSKKSRGSYSRWLRQSKKPYGIAARMESKLSPKNPYLYTIPAEARWPTTLGIQKGDLIVAFDSDGKLVGQGFVDEQGRGSITVTYDGRRRLRKRNRRAGR